MGIGSPLSLTILLLWLGLPVAAGLSILLLMTGGLFRHGPPSRGIGGFLLLLPPSLGLILIRWGSGGGRLGYGTWFGRSLTRGTSGRFRFLGCLS
jgi:hypothetical protein